MLTHGILSAGSVTVVPSDEPPLHVPSFRPDGLRLPEGCALCLRCGCVITSRQFVSETCPGRRP